MRRLIGGFAGRTYYIVENHMHWLIYVHNASEYHHDNTPMQFWSRRIVLKTKKGKHYLSEISKQHDPDQMPHTKVTSDRGLDCPLTEYSFKVRIKIENTIH